MTKPNSSQTGKRRKNRARGQIAAPELTADLRDACEAVIGYRFKDAKLLDRAMTHRSAAQGHSAEWSNERLEFLGDRVLGLVIVETLLTRFTGVREGDLAPRLNMLVSRDTCAVIGAELGLGEYLIVDSAERSTGGPMKRTLLANAMEAVIGAIYLDGGLKSASKFIQRAWAGSLKAVELAPRDPKTGLQEWAQGEGLATPAYSHVGRTGPDHSPIFTVNVRVDGYELASGTGSSKQDAERAAAKALLEQVEQASK